MITGSLANDCQREVNPPPGFPANGGARAEDAIFLRNLTYV